MGQRGAHLRAVMLLCLKIRNKGVRFSANPKPWVLGLRLGVFVAVSFFFFGNLLLGPYQVFEPLHRNLYECFSEGAFCCPLQGPRRDSTQSS